jgi:AcrR family transcriptional regulator
VKSPNEPPRSRPGGRAALVVDAVHRAAIDLLAEVGYAGLQLPDVASRAEVNKTTVYRRWPTKNHLLADLARTLAASNVTARDTGTLQGDLEALINDIHALLRHPVIRELLTAVIVNADRDEQARQLRDAFWTERFDRSAIIVKRAIARGELPAAASSHELLEDACSPLYFRALVTNEPITARDVKTFAEKAIATATREVKPLRRTKR